MIKSILIPGQLYSLKYKTYLYDIALKKYTYLEKLSTVMYIKITINETRDIEYNQLMKMYYVINNNSILRIILHNNDINDTFLSLR